MKINKRDIRQRMAKAFRAFVKWSRFKPHQDHYDFDPDAYYATLRHNADFAFYATLLPLEGSPRRCAPNTPARLHLQGIDN